MIDEAMQAAMSAHACGDVGAEAEALTALGLILCHDGHELEARSAHDQALVIPVPANVRRKLAEELITFGEEMAAQAGQDRSRMLTAQQAFYQASRILSMLGESDSAVARHAAEISEDLERRYWATTSAGQFNSGPVLPEEIALGFVAVKLVGPFLEAFATKLGERLEESTARVLRGIRLRWRSGAEPGHGDLTISLDNSVTTLVLPEMLTDEAREAFIDLDVTAAEMRGATVHWDQAVGAWRPVGPGESDASRRRPGPHGSGPDRPPAHGHGTRASQDGDPGPDAQHGRAPDPTTPDGKSR